jgi:hypothetical protein
MLFNMVNKLPEMIAVMNSSNVDFYLTGSRFWGTDHDKSDWDFFALDDKENENYKWLVSHGFTQVGPETTYTDDTSCNRVMIHGSESMVDFYRPNHEIHVQLVKSVSTKDLIQKILFETFPEGFVNKQEARKIWKAAFSVFDHRTS